MTTILDVWVPGRPVPQPRHRVARRGAHVARYVPKTHAVHAWKDRIMVAVYHAYNGPGGVGPVSVTLSFWFHRPKNRPKRIDKETWGSGQSIWHDVTPDVDNLTKAVLDALTDVSLWKDDSQVTTMHAEKRYCNLPGVPVGLGYGDPGVRIKVDTQRYEARSESISEFMQRAQDQMIALDGPSALIQHYKETGRHPTVNERDSWPCRGAFVDVSERRDAVFCDRCARSRDEHDNETTREDKSA